MFNMYQLIRYLVSYINLLHKSAKLLIRRLSSATQEIEEEQHPILEIFFQDLQEEIRGII